MPHVVSCVNSYEWTRHWRIEVVSWNCLKISAFPQLRSSQFNDFLPFLRICISVFHCTLYSNKLSWNAQYPYESYLNVLTIIWSQGYHQLPYRGAVISGPSIFLTLRCEDNIVLNFQSRQTTLPATLELRIPVHSFPLQKPCFRYFELRPQLDRCQARIQQLEGELERAKDDLTESERRHQSTYLQMFLKGQQAARLQHESEVRRFTIVGRNCKACAHQRCEEW